MAPTFDPSAPTGSPTMPAYAALLAASLLSATPAALSGCRRERPEAAQQREPPPAPPPAPEAAPPREPPPAPKVGAPAWGDLRWGMDRAAVRLALQSAKIPFEERELLMGDTVLFSIQPDVRKGTLYVDPREGLNQVHLDYPEPSSEADGKKALARLTRERGAPTEVYHLRKHRWRNGTTTLEVNMGQSTANEHSISETYVEDRRPEYVGRSPRFADVQGFGPMPWGSAADAVAAWMRKEGIPLKYEIKVVEPGINPPPDALRTPTVPQISFDRDRFHGTISFSADGMKQVWLYARAPFDNAGAEQHVADLVRRYGDPTESELSTRRTWTGGPTKVQLEVRRSLPEGSWTVFEGYTPE